MHVNLHELFQGLIDYSIDCVNGHRKQLRIQSTNKTVFFV